MLGYRVILTIAAPFVVMALVWRSLRGRESFGDLGQRLGFGSGQVGSGRTGAIWVHGASNGELTSAAKLIRALRNAHPETPLVLTCNTLSGRHLAEGWNLPNTMVRLAPLDLRWALRRFSKTWQPRILIVLENELWPNRLALISPVVAVSARMSGRSAKRWAMVPRLARTVIEQITYLAPQDENTGTHVLNLGLPASALGPVYAPKASVELQPPDPTELARLQQEFERTKTWLAASTHPGEDEIALDALKDGAPDLRLILAPRHPGRGDDIRKMALDRGLTVAQRSRAEPPAAQVYLVDTLGEMSLWYTLAGVTFVAGSLVPLGGHTPYEPTQYGSAILHGPHVSNFASVYKDLVNADASREVVDSASLAAALSSLVDVGARDGLVARAEAVLGRTTPQDTQEHVLHAISKHLASGNTEMPD